MKQKISHSRCGRCGSKLTTKKSSFRGFCSSCIKKTKPVSGQLSFDKVISK